MSSAHFTHYTLHICTLYNEHCTLYTAQCTSVSNVQCTMMLCTYIIVHCTLYIKQPILSEIPYNIIYTITL